jgi:hypothetical protein
MRIVKILFICFSLAFANVGYAYNFDTDCPMQQQVEPSHVQHISMDDCCNDVDFARATGEVCKSGQSCGFSASPLVVLSSSPSWNTASLSKRSELALIELVPDSSPSDLWRPPTFS